MYANSLIWKKVGIEIKKLGNKYSYQLAMYHDQLEILIYVTIMHQPIDS